MHAGVMYFSAPCVYWYPLRSKRMSDPRNKAVGSLCWKPEEKKRENVRRNDFYCGVTVAIIGFLIFVLPVKRIKDEPRDHFNYSQGTSMKE